MKRLSLLNEPVLSVASDHLIIYPVPTNINYFWSFGSLAGICLLIQIATGIFLAMHYTAHIDLAFLSVEHIMRDVEGGWLLRYMHANGASMFFIMVYTHMFRGLYYGSYASPREVVWCLGVVILLLMISTYFAVTLKVKSFYDYKRQMKQTLDLIEKHYKTYDFNF